MPYFKQYIRLVTYQKSEKSMAWLPRRARKRIFFTPFSPFSAQENFFMQNCLCHIQSSISGQSHTKNQKNLWSGCRDVLENAYFSHLFCHFRPKKIFSCKTAYAIFKVVYQASHIPKIRKIYGMVAKKCSKMHIFHTFFAIFGQKKFFFKNPASSVFWNHRKLP